MTAERRAKWGIRGGREERGVLLGFFGFGFVGGGFGGGGSCLLGGVFVVGVFW